MRKLLLAFSFALMLLPATLMGQAKHSGYTLPDQPKRAKYIDFPSLDQGLWFAAQATGAMAFGKSASFPIAQVDLIGGYRFNEFIKLGLGISPRLALAGAPGYGFSGEAVSLPVYLDVRGNVISQESRMSVPWWSVDLGYSIPEGFYASPTVGVRVGGPRNNFIAGVTYIFQSVAAANTSYHAVGLRLGYEF